MVCGFVFGACANTAIADQIHPLKIWKENRNGQMETWKVIDDDGTCYSNYTELPSNKQSFISSSTFPPSLQQSKEFHLEYCMRFLPHLSNSGGFFIAVLEKVDDFEPTCFSLPLSRSLQNEQKLVFCCFFLLL